MARRAPDPSPVASGAGRKAARRERRLRWTVAAGTWLIRLLGTTWRIRIEGGEIVEEARRSRQPIIFLLWHGTMFPLLYQHRREQAAVLISEHRDGELVARVADRLGFRTVRGSTTRGASRALVGLVREIAAGHDVALTPDGPRGPAHSFAPGALIVAQRAGVPLLPVGVHAARAWHLRSWDRFMIPKPFTRVTIAYGPLEHVRGGTPREAAEETRRFEALMAAAARRAMS